MKVVPKEEQIQANHTEQINGFRVQSIPKVPKSEKSKKIRKDLIANQPLVREPAWHSFHLIHSYDGFPCYSHPLACAQSIYEPQVKQQPQNESNSITTDKPLKDFQLENSKKLHTLGLFELKKPRRKNQIEVKASQREKYIRAHHGNKDETTELNINIKTAVKNWLKKLSKSMCFDDDQQGKILEFLKGPASFETFRTLFGVRRISETQQSASKDLKIERPFENYDEMQMHQETLWKKMELKKKEKKMNRAVTLRNSDRIRKLLLRFLGSPAFIKSIVSSYRMIFVSKRTVLKFLEQARMGCIHPQKFCSWKEINRFSAV